MQLRPVQRASTESPPARASAVQPADALARLLASGRELAAHVLERLSASDYILQVAGRRVPARSTLPLAPGEELIVRGESSGAEVLLHLLARAGSPGSPGFIDESLARALRELLSSERPLGEVLDSLRREAQRLAEAGGEPGTRARLLLARLAGHTWEPASAGAGLARLLARSGASLESKLAALGRTANPADVAQDLKAELVRARVELPAGPAREAARQALDALEAAQMLDAARRRGGDGQLVAFVVPDGDRLATAQLWVEPPLARLGQPHEAPDGDRPQARAAWHFAVDLDLSALGPLRAEISACGRDVHMRLRAVQRRTVEALLADVPRIVERLAALGFCARISAVHAAAAELSGERQPHDLGWLQSHHLMDVRA